MLQKWPPVLSVVYGQSYFGTVSLYVSLFYWSARLLERRAEYA